MSSIRKNVTEKDKVLYTMWKSRQSLRNRLERFQVTNDDEIITNPMSDEQNSDIDCVSSTEPLKRPPPAQFSEMLRKPAKSAKVTIKPVIKPRLKNSYGDFEGSPTYSDSDNVEPGAKRFFNDSFVQQKQVDPAMVAHCSDSNQEKIFAAQRNLMHAMQCAADLTKQRVFFPVLPPAFNSLQRPPPVVSKEGAVRIAEGALVKSKSKKIIIKPTLPAQPTTTVTHSDVLLPNSIPSTKFILKTVSVMPVSTESSTSILPDSSATDLSLPEFPQISNYHSMIDIDDKERIRIYEHKTLAAGPKLTGQQNLNSVGFSSHSTSLMEEMEKFSADSTTSATTAVLEDDISSFPQNKKKSLFDPEKSDQPIPTHTTMLSLSKLPHGADLKEHLPSNSSTFSTNLKREPYEFVELVNNSTKITNDKEINTPLFAEVMNNDRTNVTLSDPISNVPIKAEPPDSSQPEVCFKPSTKNNSFGEKEMLSTHQDDAQTQQYLRKFWIMGQDELKLETELKAIESKICTLRAEIESLEYQREQFVSRREVIQQEKVRLLEEAPPVFR